MDIPSLAERERGNEADYIRKREKEKFKNMQATSTKPAQPEAGPTAAASNSATAQGQAEGQK